MYCTRLSTIAQIVPVESIIFNVAIQIEIGSDLPVIRRYSSSLQKMVFIGDDKQLLPYGHSDISELESVFEKQHLWRKIHFLDTSVNRMPMPIGDFISEHVYNKKHKTIRNISSKTCCRFVNIPKGREHQSRIVSIPSSHAVVKVAKILQERNKSFRVITPYDTQRSTIEKSLKEYPAAELPPLSHTAHRKGNCTTRQMLRLVRTRVISG
ncbi:uncharacterized protein EV420DRAFT_1282801 [Desarmillaria tabescens]|uniref:DNA2/NAM7 helicase-like C-terminal domain-containing protein n=1 Tax=Armillaria tabescens TaxID=1929756 RepID=A0AA39J3B5_ARMTA|nr:uncharacterized protein EV420DRAFT_1282801 [Desarmillaria tabescens]KAK0434049.1 hypothetical protein EV420DRAFT_1282801 [Desarmillaria tabescens]